METRGEAMGQPLEQENHRWLLDRVTRHLVWVMRATGLGHAEVLGHVEWASPRRPGKWGHVDMLQTGWGSGRAHSLTSLAGKVASG